MPSSISWRLRVWGVPSGKSVECRSAVECRCPRRTTTRSPSASHSRIEPGARPSLRRTSAGTETCPCEVNLDCASFMPSHYHGKMLGARLTTGLRPGDQGQSNPRSPAAFAVAPGINNAAQSGTLCRYRKSHLPSPVSRLPSPSPVSRHRSPDSRHRLPRRHKHSRYPKLLQQLVELRQFIALQRLQLA